MYDIMPIAHSFIKPLADYNQMRRDYMLTHSIRSCSTDIKDVGDAYVIEAELPGFDKSDIYVSCKDDTLTVKAERKVENDAKNDDYLHRERFYGSYNRTFAFGTPIDIEQITGSYKDGVLTLSIPKVKTEPEARQIEIS